MRNYIPIILRMLVVYGLFLNILMDIGNGEFISAVVALFIATLFMLWAIKGVEQIISEKVS